MTEIVSLIRHDNYDPSAVEEAVARLLEPLGGMRSFVKPGAPVLLKPNLICARPPEDAATTHPAVLRAVARLALACGGRVSVGDSPGRGSARKAAQRAGIAQVADDLGIELVEFTPAIAAAAGAPPAPAAPPGRVAIPAFEIAQQLLDADVIINVPKLKTHCMMLMTMAVKNMFGAVLGLQKFQWHLRAGRNAALFGRILYEICRAVPPSLSVVDAVVSMHGNGPTSGRPFATGFLAAGRDPSSVDAVLLEVLGIPPDSLPTLLAASDAGDTAWRTARTAGASPRDLRPRGFVLPESASPALALPAFFQRLPGLRNWLRQQATARPFAEPERCVLCGECAAVCPAQAMELTATSVVIDDAACIRCYCCHEICPASAVGLRRSMIGRLFGRRVTPRVEAAAERRPRRG